MRVSELRFEEAEKRNRHLAQSLAKLSKTALDHQPQNSQHQADEHVNA